MYSCVRGTYRLTIRRGDRITEKTYGDSYEPIRVVELHEAVKAHTARHGQRPLWQFDGHTRTLEVDGGWKFVVEELR